MFEPRRDVDGVAGDHRLPGLRLYGREHLAGVDADPDLQRHVVARGKVLVHLLEPALHPERRTERSRRVVLVSDRHTERGHHRVADELLDGSALCFDLLAHRLEERREDLAEPFRIEALAERGRARHDGEQHRHQPSFLSYGEVRLDEGGPAARAEPRARRPLGAADGTSGDEGRATRHAEAGAVWVLRSAPLAGRHRPSVGAGRTRDRRPRSICRSIDSQRELDERNDSAEGVRS
jgi:hypothetical protein